MTYCEIDKMDLFTNLDMSSLGTLFCCGRKRLDAVKKRREKFLKLSRTDNHIVLGSKGNIAELKIK